MTSLEDVGKSPGGDSIVGFLRVSHNDDGSLKNTAGAANLSSVLSVGNDAGGTKITNLGTPTAASDAVTKSYVDSGLGSGDTLHTVAASGAAQTADYSTADVWDITLTANCTLSLAGFTSGKPDFLTLILRQDGIGGRTVTWPTITWIGSGIPPILQTATGSVDSAVLFSFDGGTTVYGIAQTSQSGLRSGTSFPGSPSDGDLFYRTDTRILYEYNSTVSRWLSVDRKYVPFGPGNILENTTTAGGIGYLPIGEDVFVESWMSTTQVSTTNNGSNNWTLTLSTASGNVTSFNTSADAASTWVVHVVAINALFTAATDNVFAIATTKTGTPGGWRGPSMLVCRSVG